MRIAKTHLYQPVSNIKVEDGEVPQPEAGEILIRVEAAGVNPVDWKLVEGHYQGVIPIALPYAPGVDVSGIVEAVGSGVSGFQIGDAVFGYPNLMRGGAYADYAVLLENELSHAPKTVTLRECAAIPVAALTAYEGLFVHGQLEAGMTILILGGAGGVGSAAVQLAKWKGAKVYATASARNQAFLEALGAVPIDYGAGNVTDFVQEVDFIFDTVGGETGIAALAGLKRGGQYVTPVFPLPPAEVLEAYGARSAAYGIQPNAERLGAISAIVDEGALRVSIDQEFPLSQIVSALETSKSGRVRGKLLVVPALG